MLTATAPPPHTRSAAPAAASAALTRSLGSRLACPVGQRRPLAVTRFRWFAPRSTASRLPAMGFCGRREKTQMLILGVFSLSSVDLLATAVPVRRLNFPACESVAPILPRIWTDSALAAKSLFCQCQIPFFGPPFAPSPVSTDRCRQTGFHTTPNSCQSTRDFCTRCVHMRKTGGLDWVYTGNFATSTAPTTHPRSITMSQSRQKSPSSISPISACSCVFTHAHPF